MKHLIIKLTLDDIAQIDRERGTNIIFRLDDTTALAVTAHKVPVAGFVGAMQDGRTIGQILDDGRY